MHENVLGCWPFNLLKRLNQNEVDILCWITVAAASNRAGDIVAR